MAIQTNNWLAEEHDLFLSLTGLPANTPLNQLKSVFFGGTGPVSQRERVWLKDQLANGGTPYLSPSNNVSQLWLEYAGNSGIDTTKLQWFEAKIKVLRSLL